MGNRSSAPLPGLAQLQKRFTPEELRRLEAQCPPPLSGEGAAAGSSSGGAAGQRSRGGGRPLAKEEFMTKFGDGMGPAMRRVLLRLFLVLDANGSGALEHEEYLAAAFFFTKATAPERLRILFSMYEAPSSSSTSSSSSASSAAANTTGYLTKNDVAGLCAETTFAMAELNPMPPSILRQLGADGGGGGAGKQAALHPSAAQLDAAVSPYRELTSVMVDVAFAKFDGDRDGRLSVAEFQQFAQHADSGVDAVLQSLLSIPYARQLWPASSS